VPHEELDEADTVPQPGANSSGLRRPSAVGPVPPEQKLPWLGVSWDAPQESMFFAFSGFFSELVLVTARQTKWSSFWYWKASKPRQSELYAVVPSSPQLLVCTVAPCDACRFRRWRMPDSVNEGIELKTRRASYAMPRSGPSTPLSPSAVPATCVPCELEPLVFAASTLRWLGPGGLPPGSLNAQCVMLTAPSITPRYWPCPCSPASHSGVWLLTLLWTIHVFVLLRYVISDAGSTYCTSSSSLRRTTWSPLISTVSTRFSAMSSELQTLAFASSARTVCMTACSSPPSKSVMTTAAFPAACSC